MRGGGSSKKEKGIQTLAWVSYGFAVVGGAALTGTFISTWIVDLVRLGPEWVSVLLFIAALVTMGVDLFVDGTPNRLALVAAVLIPSLALATSGKLSDSVANLSHQILSHVDDKLSTWVHVGSSWGVAVVAVAVSALMARRVIEKSR